jgi:hypothetical protein
VVQPVLHVADEGVRFLGRVMTRDAQGKRVPKDLTGATELVATWRKEDGTLMQGEASVYGPPADGWVLAVEPPGLLDQAGKTWAWVVTLRIGLWKGQTLPRSFTVQHAYQAAS